MANNGRIRLLRTTTDKLVTSSEQLVPGQPLYISDKNYLTIGSVDKLSLASEPITVRKVVGYYDDTNSITTGRTNLYEFSGNVTDGVVIRTPDKLNINVGSDKYLSVSNSDLLTGNTSGIKYNLGLNRNTLVSGNFKVTENIDVVKSITAQGITGTGLTINGDASVKNLTTQNINASTYEVTAKSFIGDLLGNASSSTTSVNVSGTINNHSISSIFESNGLTVKNATNADSASNYNSSGTIASKFTEIEGRLNSLGFKSSSISLASGFTASTNTLSLKNGFVLGTLSLTGGGNGFYKDAGQNTYATISQVVGTIPEGYRPKTESTFGVNCVVKWSIGSASANVYWGNVKAIISTNGNITIQSSVKKNNTYAANAVIVYGEGCILTFGYEAA